MAFIVIRPLTWKEVGGRLSLNLIILCVLLIVSISICAGSSDTV